MTRRTLFGSFMILPVLALAGCHIFQDPKGGPGQVNDLVGWVERVHVETELSKEKMHAAMDTLQSVVMGNYRGDAVSAFSELKETHKQSEDQAVKLRASVENMKKIATPVFERWSTDLGAFASSDMRLRSEIRLSETREKYYALVAAVDPTQAMYDAFNRGLRDHMLFLGHDFNATSVGAVRDDARTLAKLAVELDGKFDRCMQAARTYVQSSALPMTAAPAPGGSGGDRPQPQQPPARGGR